MEERLLEDGQENGQQIVSKDAGENVERRRRALAEVPVGQGAVVVAATFVVARVTL